MLYEPRLVVNLYEILGGALFRAALLAFGDFVAQENKPWSYYLGAVFGYAAAATGIPGAAATLFAVGTSVDALLFHSPDGSLVKCYLNGILVATIDTFAASPSWENVTISGLAVGLVNELRFVSEFNPNGDKTSTIEWFGLGTITVNGSGAYALGSRAMAHNTVVVRLQDSESDVRYGSVPFYVPTGFTKAQIQTWFDGVAPLLDAVTGAKLASASVNMVLDLPGGLKSSPDTNVLNERGGLITFDTTGVYKDSFRIPAILPAIMSGDSFSLADTDIAALITVLTTTTNSIRPTTGDDFNWVTARKGSKSFRR